MLCLQPHYWHTSGMLGSCHAETLLLLCSHLGDFRACACLWMRKCSGVVLAGSLPAPPDICIPRADCLVSLASQGGPPPGLSTSGSDRDPCARAAPPQRPALDARHPQEE